MGKTLVFVIYGTWIRAMTAWDGTGTFFSIFLSYEVFLYGVWGIQLFSFFCSVYFARCDICQIGVGFFLVYY
jgi:hypothetical protein